ncbi:hypothetical protein EC991_002136 [Linnemannia zychae]|nr:hypothetical protein EC991_002136 [Linnemannia zychae]
MNFITVIATLAIVATSSVSAQGGSYSNWLGCADGPGPLPVTVTSASFTPSPICVGQEYCFEVTGTSSVPITQGANISSIVNSAGRFYPVGQYDMCTLLAESGTPCPIPAGPVSLKYCFNYLPPRIIKNLSLYWSFDAHDVDGNFLFCQYVVPNNNKDANGAPLGLYPKQC